MRESGDVDKERRDLYAVSLAIILFNLAGGSFAGNLGTPIGTIQFSSDVFVLHSAAWIAWMYFFWRFRLAAGDVFGSFQGELRTAVVQSPFFRKINGRQLALRRKRYEVLSSEPTDSTTKSAAVAMLNSVDWDDLENNYAPTPVEKTYLTKFDFARTVRIPDARNGVHTRPFASWHNQALGADAMGEWRPALHQWARYSLESIWIAIIVRPYFGDKVLPYLVAATTPAIALLRMVGA